MGDNIVDLDSQRPHTSGPMFCHGCGHEWIGVLRSGMVAADCPECHQGKGMRGGFVLPDDVDAWHCTECEGCSLFTFYYNHEKNLIGMMCANCGTLHDLPTLADV